MLLFPGLLVYVLMLSKDFYICIQVHVQLLFFFFWKLLLKRNQTCKGPRSVVLNELL